MNEADVERTYRGYPVKTYSPGPGTYLMPKKNQRPSSAGPYGRSQSVPRKHSPGSLSWQQERDWEHQQDQYWQSAGDRRQQSIGGDPYNGRSNQQAEGQQKQHLVQPAREYGTGHLLDETGRWMDRQRPPPVSIINTTAPGYYPGVAEVVSYLDESPRNTVATQGLRTNGMNSMKPEAWDGSPPQPLATTVAPSNRNGQQQQQQQVEGSEGSRSYYAGSGSDVQPGQYITETGSNVYHDARGTHEPGHLFNVPEAANHQHSNPTTANKVTYSPSTKGSSASNKQRPASAGSSRSGQQYNGRPTSAGSQRSTHTHQRPASAGPRGPQAQSPYSRQNPGSNRPGTAACNSNTRKSQSSILDFAPHSQRTLKHPFEMPSMPVDLNVAPSGTYMDPELDSGHWQDSGFQWDPSLGQAKSQGKGIHYGRPATPANYQADPASPSGMKARPATPTPKPYSNRPQAYSLGAKTQPQYLTAGVYDNIKPYGHVMDTQPALTVNELEQAREMSLGQHVVAGSPHARLVGGRWKFVEESSRMRAEAGVPGGLGRSLTAEDIARTKDLSLGQHVVPGSPNSRLVGGHWRHMPQPTVQEPMWTDYYGPLGGGADKCVFYGRKYNEPKIRFGIV
ncbi:hypothetical protein CEUSTIGMA_g3814.t1 [Chlamydomonas eustigma]|uniref:Uncharacterized protein n=1 Tax=Chlamydomonas eustigma TaxID=1157962 RepID=A0A250WZV6_9CHLO|nr:hypothetical protein CEUSTIGMA_g3814.t1 [Chlamydomonas eustigma]|eukprot:GAX76368.1 hypothetical protein CEUSTIGMA_g3814.t1 [Chlamydomonas eustigma]